MVSRVYVHGGMIPKPQAAARRNAARQTAGPKALAPQPPSGTARGLVLRGVLSDSSPGAIVWRRACAPTRHSFSN